MEETDPGGMLRSALRIDDIDQLRLSATERLSVICVDISERPDLAVLAVRNARTPSDAVCTWFSRHPGMQPPIVGLRIAMTQPTTAVFTLVFPMGRFAGHLSIIAKDGKLWIVPGPPLPRPVGSQEMDAQTFFTHVSKYSGQGMWIELEAPLVAALRTQLAEWKRIR